jgi:hypothetical protein
MNRLEPGGRRVCLDRLAGDAGQRDELRRREPVRLLDHAACVLAELPGSSSTSAHLTSELQAGTTYTLIDTETDARADFTPR